VEPGVDPALDSSSVRGLVFARRTLFIILRSLKVWSRGGPHQTTKAIDERKVDSGVVLGELPLDEVADLSLDEEAEVALDLLAELELVKESEEVVTREESELRDNKVSELRANHELGSSGVDLEGSKS